MFFGKVQLRAERLGGDGASLAYDAALLGVDVIQIGPQLGNRLIARLRVGDCLPMIGAEDAPGVDPQRIDDQRVGKQSSFHAERGRPGLTGQLKRHFHFDGHAVPGDQYVGPKVAQHGLQREEVSEHIAHHALQVAGWRFETETLVLTGLPEVHALVPHILQLGRADLRPDLVQACLTAMADAPHMIAGYAMRAQQRVLFVVGIENGHFGLFAQVEGQLHDGLGDGGATAGDQDSHETCPSTRWVMILPSLCLCP